MITTAAIIYSVLVTLWALGTRARLALARADARRLRTACENAEAALEEIANAEMETANLKIVSGEELARRLGVDIKSRLP